MCVVESMKGIYFCRRIDRRLVNLFHQKQWKMNMVVSVVDVAVEVAEDEDIVEGLIVVVVMKKMSGFLSKNLDVL